MSSEGGIGVLNGQGTKEAEKSWERPWSTDEIRKNSDKWTLAGDVGLLKHLQEFSHHLISRTHEMEKVVDGLVHQSKDTCAKVNNVINDFQMLSNLKFVENRVYDEEIVDDTKNLNTEDQPKSKEQREIEMLTRVKQALDLGLSVLDTAFERIEDIESSDSEGEDMSEGRTRLEPKDYYEHRPLPFIIGSEEFKSDEYAGLKYLVDEEPVLEYSAQDDNVSSISEDSESDIDDDDDDFEFDKRDVTVVSEQRLTEPTFTVDLPRKPTLNENLNKKRSDSEGSDLFGDEENGYASSASIEESPKETKSKNKFLDELATKIKPGELMDKTNTGDLGPVTEKQKSPEDLLVNRKKMTDVRDEENDENDLFASEDSFLNSEESPFGKNKGLFTTGTKFDAGNDMFSDKDLFGKGEKTLFVKKTDIPEKKQPVSKKADDSFLFGNDDDDDLFGSLSSSNITTESKKSVSKAANTKVLDRADKASPSPSVSTKGSIKSISSKAKSEDSLFGMDSDNDELFSDVKTTTQNKMSFDFGNDNDDLFGILGTSEKKVTKSEVSEKKETTKKGAPEIKPTLDSLFDNDDFDLFGTKETVKKMEQPKLVTKTQDKEKSPRKTVHKDPVPSIFDDTSALDLFSPAQATKDVEFMAGDLSALETAQSKEIISQKEVSSKSDIKVFQKPSPPSDDKYQLQRENQMTPIMDIIDSSVKNELSFESPISNTNTLSALNKDRVKIQAKRRKPTRKGRQALHSADEEQNLVGEKKTELEAQHSTTTETANSRDLFASVGFGSPDKNTKPAKIDSAPTYKKKEQQKKDLMSQLMSEVTERRKSLLEIESHDNDDFDILSDVSTKEEPRLGSDFSFVSPSSLKSDFLDKPSKEPEKLESKKDDFFTSSFLSDDDLFSDKSLDPFHNNASNEKLPFSPEDDDDDIFKIDEGKHTVLQDSDDIFANDGNDIFANDGDIFSDMEKEKEKYNMFPATEHDDDDEDIFSNFDKPTVTKGSKAKNQAKDERKSSDIFDDPLGLLS